MPYEVDTILHKSCLDYLTQLNEKHPEGVFDLAFADPPYHQKIIQTIRMIWMTVSI